jgi:hypothetical protein
MTPIQERIIQDIVATHRTYPNIPLRDLCLKVHGYSLTTIETWLKAPLATYLQSHGPNPKAS